jgi:hypothetical protein
MVADTQALHAIYTDIAVLATLMAVHYGNDPVGDLELAGLELCKLCDEAQSVINRRIGITNMEEVKS